MVHAEISSSGNATAFVPLISHHARFIFEMVNLVTLSGLICIFGIFSNIINIIIFIKQGLDNTMTISFLSLAISDLCSVMTLKWTGICMNPLLLYTDFPMDGVDVEYLTGSWPHVCFGHITCWITAYITAERCLCIALPLKVKQIVTPRRTITLMVIMYAINLLPYCFECSYAYVDWTFVEKRNKTLLGLKFREDRKDMEGISFILLGLFGIISFPAVIIFTAILVTKLRQQAAWRQKTTRDSKQSDLTSKRDIKTMNMVVLIASILIVCYTPGVMASLISFFVSGFSVKGTLTNMFFAVWSSAFVCEAFNSSVNIFLYYNMSTKYKNTFHELFYLCSSNKALSTSKDAYADDNE